MKITIFTLGTRGDVQPFALLGGALQKKGHNVTLCTAKNFKNLVEGYGLNFHAVDTDYEEILNSKEGRKILQANLLAIQRNLKSLIFPLIESSLTQFYHLAKSSDLIIYRPKTLVDVFVNQIPVKAIRAAVIPAVEETSEFSNPMFSALNLPDFLNKWSYKLNKYRFKFFKKPINDFYLKNRLKDDLPDEINNPFIYGISPSLLSKPDDWPANHSLTGFWLPPSNSDLPVDISEFIKSGEPPLLITFGSMPIKEELKTLIIKAVKRVNHRFIIIKGWADWETGELKDEKKFKIINTVPFEDIFPFVKAVIHHGGIGTTAECLRSGKPMFICPITYPVGDQYFWGDLAYKKGIGIKPVALSKLKPKIFAEKINELLVCKDLYQNAETLAERIKTEDGLSKAVDIIEAYCKAIPFTNLPIVTPMAS